MPKTTTSFENARPLIAVAEKDNQTLSEDLLSLLIVENTSGLYRCEAQFNNWGDVNNGIGFLYFDRKLLDYGKSFQVKLNAGKGTIFNGRIMAFEAQFPEGEAPKLTILAEDRFQDLRMTRHTRTFSDVSDADVFNQLANEHGLSPSVDVTGPHYKVLAQVNQSDLAFMRERARAIDAELWMDGTTLNIKAHTKRASGRLTIDYGRDLREFSVLADLAGQRTSVTVCGWDVASKEGLRHEVTEDILAGELNGDQSGATILGSALGQRKESLTHTVPLSSEEAKVEAEAYFKMSARRFLVGHGIADANSDLRVGNYVTLSGLGPLFSGKYYLTEVMHLFDGGHGIRTEFTAERPGLGRT